MVFPILARMALGAVSGLANLTIGSLSQIGNIAGATTTALGESYVALNGLIQQFQMFAQSAQGAYNATIGANEKLNQSLLKSQIILAGVTDVYDSLGNKIEGTADKIIAFKGPLGEARRGLEKDTLELVGVTSELTFNVFDKVLRQFGTLQGQSKGFKTDIEAVTALAKNLTAALGTFGLTDVVQIEQEIRSLLTGDYNNPDSVLNKSLGLSKEERAKARSEGREVEYILSKTEDAVVGNKLGSNSLTNTLSNIADTVQIFLRDISAPFGDIISKELQSLNSEMKKLLENPEFKEQAEDFFRTLVNGAVSVGKGILAIGQFLSDIGIVSLVGMIAKGSIQLVDLIGKLFQMLGDLSKWIINKIIKPVTDFATGLWKKLTDPIGELGNAIKNLPAAELLINSDAFKKLREEMRNPIKIYGIPAILPQQQLDEDFRNQLESTHKASLAFNRRDFVIEEKKAIKAFAENSGINEREVIDLRNTGYSFSRIMDEKASKESTLGKLKSLREIEGEAITGPVVSRIGNITSLQNLDVNKETKDLINELANLEKNASIDNTGERKQLVTRIITKLNGFETMNTEAKQYLNNIKSLEETIENAKSTGASQGIIDELQAELKKAQDFALENTLEADLIILPKLAPDKGTLKSQLKESVDSAISTIASSEDFASINTGFDNLVKSLPEAIKTGAITEAEANRIFKSLITSGKLTYSQLGTIQGVYTNTIAEESSKRIAILQMEEETVSAKYSKGLISKRQKDKEINEYAIEKNKEEIKLLEKKLNLALTKSEGKESQETQAFRVEIGSKLAKGASLDAQSVSIKYNADISDIEKTNGKFKEISDKSKELTNQNLIRLTNSGVISGSDKSIKESQNNIKNINEEIIRKRKELGELGKLTPGLSEEEKEKNRQLLSEKRLQLLQLQTQELQSQFDLIDKLFNKELSDIDKKSNQNEKIQQRENLEKRILDLSLENSDTQLEIESKVNSINTILKDISQSEETLSDLRSIDAKTKDQQTIKEEKISQEINNQLSLKVNLLEIQREILGTLDQIGDRERDNRIAQLNNQLQAIKNERELLALRRELGLIKTSSDIIEETKNLIKLSGQKEKGPSKAQEIYEEVYKKEIKNRATKDPITGESTSNLDNELDKFKTKEEILGEKRKEYQEKYWRFQDQKTEEAKQLATEIYILEAEITAEKEKALQIAKEEKEELEAKKAIELEKSQIEEAERIAKKVKEIETLENKLEEIDLKIKELEIAKQIAKIESDSAITKLESEKEVLKLTLERLKAEGLLTPEAEEAANKVIEATDKQISLAKERALLDQQNYQDQIDSFKEAQNQTGNKIKTEEKNLQEEINNGLESSEKFLTPKEGLDKIKNEAIKPDKPVANNPYFINKALTSGQAIVDIGTNLNRKLIPPPRNDNPTISNPISPTIDNSTNSQDNVTVVNNFPTYSEERNTKRLLGF